MNLPNKLTLFRVVLTVFFVVALHFDFPLNESLALFLFVFASLTDYWDGRIARKYGLITNFGKLMDPLVDKILTCSAFISFVGLDLVAAWMVVVIVARELSITGMRMMAASQNRVLAAEGLGKHKTTSQMTAIIAILVVISYEQWGAVGQWIFGWPVFTDRAWIVDVASFSIWAATFLTIVSGSSYLWKNRDLFLNDM